VDTKEVIANEEDSFIQKERQIREHLLCCITFKHIYAYTTGILEILICNSCAVRSGKIGRCFV